MGRTDTDQTAASGSPVTNTIPESVVRSRWLLVIAVFAIVAFGTRAAPTVPQYGLVGAMIVSNIVLALLRNRDLQLTQALEVLTIVDVLVVTLVVGWVDPSPATYLAVFAGLVLAMALGRVGIIMVMMALVCAAYAGYLYAEIGPDFWRRVPLIVRVPFLFAVGLHFASIAYYLKHEKAQRDVLLAKAKQHAERADHLSKEGDRLRALSQIGRLALTSSDAPPVRVLLEMAARAQRALGGTRCSVIVFPRNAQQRRWQGRTKDRNTEVRCIEGGVEALRPLLLDGKISELHPGDDKDLMARVKTFYPDSNPFGSLLVSPIESDGNPYGALFLLDGDHKRKYNDGERDFFWTVSLMTGAFIEARAKLENELQLRTLITNAPVIMFAANAEGIVTLFEGRGAAVLKGRPGDRVGKELFAIVGNPDETRESFDQALEGRIAGGTMLLDETMFETQFSPLRGVDGQISGVMGVTTAILDAPMAKSAPAPAAGSEAAPPAGPAPPPPAGADGTSPPPQRPPGEAADTSSPDSPPAGAGDTPAPVPPPAPPAQPPAAPGSDDHAGAESAPPESPSSDEEEPRRRPATPGARPDLKPMIPLADED